MEDSLALFWHSIIAIRVLVQDTFMGCMNKGAHDSIVPDSKSKTAENWNANKLGTDQNHGKSIQWDAQVLMSKTY